MAQVTINIQNGTLGSIADVVDGTAGLVIGCDVGATGVVAGDVLTLTSVDDCITNKLALIPYAYQQIKEFYAEAGNGAILYVLPVADTLTLANIALKTNAYAKKLLDYAQGDIMLLGICRKPAAGYTPTITNAIDADCAAAITNLQALAVDYQTAHTPFVGIVEGRSYSGTAASLTDYTAASNNYVGITLACTDDLYAIDAAASSVGLILGRASKVPVQRKISRVKDGSLAITGVYYGSATLENTAFALISAKGFITIGTYPNRTGYYFMNDNLATIQTDDYKSISNRRVVNKATRIVDATYTNELNDEIKIDSEGKIDAAKCAYYESIIENAVNGDMLSAEEISSFSAYVNPAQNVLSTGKVTITGSIVPVGYAEEIVFNLGFSNPAL